MVTGVTSKGLGGNAAGEVGWLTGGAIFQRADAEEMRGTAGEPESEQPLRI